MKTMHRIIAAATGLLVVGIGIDGLFDRGVVIQESVAIIGRPLTPLSGAGVARRTTRRVIRRSAIYAATLPANCSTIIIEGTSLYQCGATYYQPYGNQYVVVYVD